MLWKTYNHTFRIRPNGTFIFQPDRHQPATRRWAAREPPLSEKQAEKARTSDAADADGTPTMSERSAVRLVVLEKSRNFDATHGKTRR